MFYCGPLPPFITKLVLQPVRRCKGCRGVTQSRLAGVKLDRKNRVTMTCNNCGYSWVARMTSKDYREVWFHEEC